MRAIAAVGPLSGAAARAAPPAGSPARPAPRVAFRSFLLRADAASLDHKSAPALARHAASLPLLPASTASSRPDRASSGEEGDSFDPRQGRHGVSIAADGAYSAGFASGFVSPGSAPPAAAVLSARAAASLEELMPALVRRIAWSGDRHHGTVRLEIGAGALSGATLLVEACEGHVRVQLEVPPGVDARRWQDRIRERLASRGLSTADVEVT